MSLTQWLSEPNQQTQKVRHQKCMAICTLTEPPGRAKHQTSLFGLSAKHTHQIVYSRYRSSDGQQSCSSSGLLSQTGKLIWTCLAFCDLLYLKVRWGSHMCQQGLCLTASIWLGLRWIMVTWPQCDSDGVIWLAQVLVTARTQLKTILWGT